MQKNPEIKRFVQGVLGCSCPQEVFNKIDCQDIGDGISGRKINVGERLLIYIITMDDKTNIQVVIDSALEQGVEERNKNGLVRFRLVLVTSRPDDLRNSAEHAFNSSGYTDEKTHLHILNESELEIL